jgi:hypothetical protein
VKIRGVGVNQGRDAVDGIIPMLFTMRSRSRIAESAPLRSEGTAKLFHQSDVTWPSWPRLSTIPTSESPWNSRVFGPSILAPQKQSSWAVRRYRAGRRAAQRALASACLVSRSFRTAVGVSAIHLSSGTPRKACRPRRLSASTCVPRPDGVGIQCILARNQRWKGERPRRQSCRSTSR